MRKTSKKGFTLVETLVAIGLFGIIVSIAAGGFVRALKTQAQIVALMAVNTNASLAIEQMAREIRTGYEFECVALYECNVLKFTNADADKVEYRLGRGGGIERGVNGTDFSKITADNIKVEYLTFRLLGELTTDQAVPRVTINLGISPSSKSIETAPVQIQTTVSSRQADG